MATPLRAPSWPLGHPEWHGGLGGAKSLTWNDFSHVLTYVAEASVLPLVWNSFTMQDELRLSVPRQDSCSVVLPCRKFCDPMTGRETTVAVLKHDPVCFNSSPTERRGSPLEPRLCKTSWPVKDLQGHAATVSRPSS